ncbi:hypothetical protein [Dendronalium sp. ChiSLP03b]|uniref:hypothetical protein n=1 Tax=Dendronalium sp. ChiSLP03b TaxID=3075381 RepID=UPI002AD4C6C5|nr:hypothetical protein [Dendronalium sp. ChiSLP03b]MDZ8209337.1 hypothetical protein [Dendronalium sp. ChiSLP03b]
MTATIARPKSKKSTTANKQQSPYKRLHVIIPIEDMLWASQQKPSVNQLWQECWTSDPYGSRWMLLSTTLGYSSFICAKKILAESGLFIFKPDKSIQDGRETVGWMVRNLHGSRMKDFWEKVNAENQEPNAQKQEFNAENTDIDAGSEEIDAENLTYISDENQSEQGFGQPSRTPHQHLTNSSVEFVRCVSSTQDKNSHGEETAIAPLRGASPQSVLSVEEKEEDSPTATDCTSLRLVDAASSQSASLMEEKPDFGDEPKTAHEDTFSAASVAANSENTNQPQNQAQPSHSASLIAENSSSAQEPKNHHEGQSSALADSNPEKWSHEAVMARSKARPGRMQKLNMAERLRENPGFEFLMECWADDPALRIIIKKLAVKFPQWGLVAVDGMLVKWNK